ncbi:MAG: YeeE/YedE family protein [SAR116 cluster bacterium]|nr:YeeE/YedE family protein [SAR116 cluster bacterium]RPG92328.1 MAG: YeeE/YedE family protein [Candidatus Puniceispirillum sp. TMED213]|tara:strand:+ start:176 stop:607 length:432 start_codon:yes stop_codon:yes gene_type:complete
MQINWAEFTPILSLLGGMLIGGAALLLMLANGRVMGVSSILGGLLGKAEPKNWRLAFIAGAILAPIFLVQSGLYDIPVQRVANGATLYIAAFLVGLGTAIGSGCTSGHGICGLSRLSARSFVAVAIFITTAIITVYMFRHCAG